MLFLAGELWTIVVSISLSYICKAGYKLIKKFIFDAEDLSVQRKFLFLLRFCGNIVGTNKFEFQIEIFII